jgi:sigma-B regulation protein RsbQ
MWRFVAPAFDDVVEIGRALDWRNAVFVGHSVSAMIGVLASLKAPGMFAKLVLVGPSPRYIDDGDHVRLWPGL